ncbi:HTH-type transcriptional regulator LeuO [Pseudovibrio axinellae]|uniref:HTH-type transcriptional regulator LeuO n=1 Tax=Pseudovibrio axinellae TaxID=989403 RepID=A0A165ZSW4_9HYPH|nr:LysR family transcriptional regulator [Pseudovibrio axinellae]KZL20238.1 HTH-type transcriptional regulator LeuO [Pseudovibrio axinellae]SEQ62225.1 DNA-binding transcriptional regulator, LysR family [Pseudovibrio axinellae]
MNLRRTDLNLLTVFDAVMREASVTRAAEKLGMSQPAVSNAISRLRVLLKDELFIRTAHGVRPTVKALHYAGQIQRILDQVTLMLSETEAFDAARSERTFNLVLGDYGEMVVLPALMQYLDEIQAKITINVLSPRQFMRADALRKGTVDFILGYEPMAASDIKNELVIEESLVSLARIGHPIVKESLTLDQYVSVPHVVIDWPNSRGSMVDQQLRSLSLQRQHRMRVHSFFDMPRVVATTNMVCTVPSQMAHQFAVSHNLVSFPVPIPDTKQSFYLIWHSSFEGDPGLIWLKNVISGMLENAFPPESSLP